MDEDCAAFAVPGGLLLLDLLADLAGAVVAAFVFEEYLADAEAFAAFVVGLAFVDADDFVAFVEGAAFIDSALRIVPASPSA